MATREQSLRHLQQSCFVTPPFTQGRQCATAPQQRSEAECVRRKADEVFVFACVTPHHRFAELPLEGKPPYRAFSLRRRDGDARLDARRHC